MFNDSSQLRIIFAGTPEFAAQHLAVLKSAGHQLVGILTQPDRPAGRGKKLLASPVKQLALQYGLPLWQPSTLRDEALQEKLATLKPDIMIVVAYGLIVPPILLALPQFGCLNVHASLLPRWRGAAPIQRAILAGDAETGITLMRMEAGLDSGPILQQVTCPITEQTTTAELLRKLAQLGSTSLLQLLPRLAQQQVTAQPQPTTGITYADKIDKREAALDWQLPAIELARAVRAFIPWPLSYFELQGQRIKIWQAVACSQPVAALPKTILAADRQGIRVATGMGSLLLQQLQLPGKRPVSAHELLNAYRHWFSLGSTLI
ncbi:MAG: methionyl-tRNA formyltransferase [Candidatus Symbiodolus clandestinus]